MLAGYNQIKLQNETKFDRDNQAKRYTDDCKIECLSKRSICALLFTAMTYPIDHFEYMAHVKCRET